MDTSDQTGQRAAAGSRAQLAHVALAQIPKLLTLQDRNPHSPAYGCFDRNFWHYRIIDFPSGMAQEFVWPLALAVTLDVPDNPYFAEPGLKAWVRAGILYAARSAHADGSCDDYFPYERASGAAAFSLLACLESYSLLGLHEAVENARDNNGMLGFFRRRADWLAAHEESGRLSNHQALVALCLMLAGRLLNTSRWEAVAHARLQRLLDWQSAEGWFPEYEGCDPGYHTLTISILARCCELSASDTLGNVLRDALRQSLERAVNLAAELMHPDGSFGGEYGSRNTCNYFPHGFELVGRWWPQALTINDAFLAGLARGRGACHDDDHIIGHHTWNYLLAWRDFVSTRPAAPPRRAGRLWLREAGIIIDRRENTELYLALNKGGTFKFFRDRELVLSDTQLSVLVTDQGRTRNAVGHLVDHYENSVSDHGISIAGTLGWAKHTQMTPLRLILLRVVMLSVGRFFPDLIRRLLQNMLITGKRPAPFRFQRHFSWRDGHWHVRDELHAERPQNITAVGIGGDQTSIYVVMSRTFQPGQLQPWLNLGDQLTPQAMATPEQALLTLERRL